MSAARMEAARSQRTDPRTVADLMHTDVVTLSPAASIRELATLLYRHRISGVPVVDDDGTVVGTASVTDLIWLSDLIAPDRSDPEARVRRRELDERTVRDIMTPDVFGVGPDATVGELGRFFIRTGLHRALVLDGGRLVGIASVTDLLGLVVERPREPNVSDA
jgi:CBS-domain-containing membrane protein